VSYPCSDGCDRRVDVADTDLHGIETRGGTETHSLAIERIVTKGDDPSAPRDRGPRIHLGSVGDNNAGPHEFVPSLTANAVEGDQCSETADLFCNPSVDTAARYPLGHVPKRRIRSKANRNDHDSRRKGNEAESAYRNEWPAARCECSHTDRSQGQGRPGRDGRSRNPPDCQRRGCDPNAAECVAHTVT
jgi:hypothetical protein